MEPARRARRAQQRPSVSATAVVKAITSCQVSRLDGKDTDGTSNSGVPAQQRGVFARRTTPNSASVSVAASSTSGHCWKFILVAPDDAHF